ncbi:hypothetical protein [Sphingomonas sp. LB3N6]|uniref:hypothetical protein n=1 Tax=Sphingomonas fucosidasi TaxID=3096164 RepID=UPI002FC9EE0F
MPLVLPPDVIVATEDSVLTQLDRERERAQMTVLTDGGAKKYVYNRKAVEVIDSRSLTVALLNALSLTDKQKRYPFAYAEMLATGDTLAVVLARFEAGLTASSAKIATIEAQAQKAKRAVRAAPTIAAKQAAAQVNWSV